MPSEVQPPPRIADYELVRLIGSGSYGDVWLARGVTGVFRAVKIVWRDRFNDPRPYAREFEGVTSFAAISLREPSQLALLHAGRNDEAGFFYYVMELADDAERGRDIEPASYVPLTLKELRGRRDRLPVPEVIALGVGLARALGSLHTNGLVHRDIKPSNIVLVGGVPKLADVGLVATASEGLTFVGTEGFVPPEGPGAPAADVFSLGKVLYELATGLDRQDFPRLPPNLSGWPDRRALLELNEVLLRACEPIAAHRFVNATALLDELLLLQAGKSVRRLRNAERRTARALRIAAVLALVASVAAVGGWIEHQRAARAVAERDLLARKNLYGASLARAQRALETGNLGLTRRILNDAAPKAGEADMRGFEWHALMAETRGDPANVVPGRGPGLEAVHLSAGAGLVAGISDDHRATLWDAGTLQPIRTIDQVRKLAGFSADGRWLVGTNEQSALQRWSVTTGIPDLMDPPKTTEWPIAAVGTDEVLTLTTRLASPRQIRRWNFKRGEDAFALPIAIADPADWTIGLRPTFNGHGLCAIGVVRLSKPPLHVWRLQVYDLERRLPIYDEIQQEHITALAISADGRWLGSALAESGEVRLHDLSSRTLVWRQRTAMGLVESMAFAPDGKQLAIGGKSGRVRLMNVAAGAKLRDLTGHDGGVNYIVWPEQTGVLYSAGTAGDLRRWDLGAPLRASDASGFWASSLDRLHVNVSADGSWFAAAVAENGFGVGSTSTLKVGEPGYTGWIPLGIDPRAGAVFAMTRSGEVLQHALAGNTTQPLAALFPPNARLADASMSSDLRRVVAASTAGDVVIWDLVARKKLLEAQIRPGALHWVAISPNGEMVATGGFDQTARLWSPPAKSPVAEWPHVPRATHAAFSNDLKLLALCFLNGEVEVRSLETRALVAQFRTDSPQLWSLAFSRDDRRLFCGGLNGTVWVYDTTDWRPLVALATEPESIGQGAPIAHLAAGENILLAYQENGRLHAWGPR